MSNTICNEPKQCEKEMDSSTGMECNLGYITYMHSGKGCVPPGEVAACCLSPLVGSPWGIACFFLLGIRNHLPLTSTPGDQGMPSIFVPGAEDKRAQVWEGAAGWQWPVWYIHTMCHYFLFCSHDLWSGKQLQLHTLSFVRHYLILQREVYKLLAELWTW